MVINYHWQSVREGQPANSRVWFCAIFLRDGVAMHRYVITGTDFHRYTSSLGLISTEIRHYWDWFPQRYVITGTDFHRDTSSLGLISTEIRHHWDWFPQRYAITGTDFHRDTSSLGLISTEIRHHWDWFPQRYVITLTDFHRDTSSLGLISTEIHHHWDWFPQRYAITGTDFHRDTSSVGLISTEMRHHLSTVISKNRNCGNTVVSVYFRAERRWANWNSSCVRELVCTWRQSGVVGSPVVGWSQRAGARWVIPQREIDFGYLTPRQPWKWYLGGVRLARAQLSKPPFHVYTATYVPFLKDWQRLSLNEPRRGKNLKVELPAVEEVALLLFVCLSVEFSSPGLPFCVCWLLFRYPLHPCVTAVARKRSLSLCQ